MPKKKTKKSSSISAGEIIGLGAAVAAAAGAYFLYGKGRKAHTRVQSWALKARADVLEELEKAKQVSEGTYQDIIEHVAAKYAKLKNVDPHEFKAMVADVRGHLENIKKQMNSTAPKKSTRASSKKQTKK